MLIITHQFTGTSLANLDKRVERAIKYGRYEVGKVLNKSVAMMVAHIYARRIPTKRQVRAYNRTGFHSGKVGGSGSPAWKRTGALRLGQRLRLPDKLTAEIVIRGRAGRPITGSIGGYAQRRHGLGLTWMPRKPALGIVRRNPFFIQAAAARKETIADSFKRGFDKGML